MIKIKVLVFEINELMIKINKSMIENKWINDWS